MPVGVESLNDDSRYAHVLQGFFGTLSFPVGASMALNVHENERIDTALCVLDREIFQRYGFDFRALGMLLHVERFTLRACTNANVAMFAVIAHDGDLNLSAGDSVTSPEPVQQLVQELVQGLGFVVPDDLFHHTPVSVDQGCHVHTGGRTSNSYVYRASISMLSISVMYENMQAAMLPNASSVVAPQEWNRISAVCGRSFDTAGQYHPATAHCRSTPLPYTHSAVPWMTIADATSGGRRAANSNIGNARRLLCTSSTSCRHGMTNRLSRTAL